VFCRECGTQEFKNDPPKVAARITIAEMINHCATALDEMASSREMMLSWIMAAWIAFVWAHLVRTSYSQAAYYFGSRVQWWNDVALPLLTGVTFIIAPLVGIWSLARWLRQGEKRMILNLMAWMLLALFVGIFCLVWIVFWDGNIAHWFRI
jgi:hypothetical protein